MTQYTFRQVLEGVINILKAGRTPAIWGPPGIGKSSLGRLVAERLKAELVTLDVPLLQPIDYMAAVPNHEMKRVMLYPSGFIPQEGPAVILVEDLTHAKPYQQIPIMQMVLDRRIGPLQFSKDVYFIITGNNEEDLAGTSALISPLLNRLVNIEMKPDLQEWVDWAKENNLDDRVIGFVQSNPQFFLQLPQEGQKTWSTPRTLHMLSDIIKATQKNIPDSLLKFYANCTIGPQATQSFIIWCRHLRDVNPKKIIEEGQVPEVDSDDKVRQFALVLSVANYMKHKSDAIKKFAKNIGPFFEMLVGEMKMAFIKELALSSGKKPGANSKLIEDFSRACPSAITYLKESFDATPQGE